MAETFVWVGNVTHEWERVVQQEYTARVFYTDPDLEEKR